ncbi:hypothetical protein NUM_25200 [Actinocatenispora comari]|uniref:HTH arsR-type domain-containing protein n=1 Tax=Actinocatenispora comari TaxID=2807577 RepID=A0A8J4A939_9ACTN|nr:hypothetical protein NUM_25200 [Actinocatenispora comari]
MAFVLSGGNLNDCTRFTEAMDAIWVPHPGSGRPRCRPDPVLADKGYSSRAIRTWLRERHISHTIPERADQIAGRKRRGRRGGRPPAFNKQLYQARGSLADDLPPRGGVARLLGPGRARVLAEVRTPATSSQLAVALDLSLGTVSAHLATLRQAGVVTRQRTGRSVYYERTPLGDELVGLITGAVGSPVRR